MGRGLVAVVALLAGCGGEVRQKQSSTDADVSVRADAALDGERDAGACDDLVTVPFGLRPEDTIQLPRSCVPEWPEGALLKYAPKSGEIIAASADGAIMGKYPACTCRWDGGALMTENISPPIPLSDPTQ